MERQAFLKLEAQPTPVRCALTTRTETDGRLSVGRKANFCRKL
jgi:hypothetical protein